MCPAAETVVKSLLIADGKAGRFLVMKRAAGFPFVTRLLQLGRAADQRWTASPAHVIRPAIEGKAPWPLIGRPWAVLQVCYPQIIRWSLGAGVGRAFLCRRIRSGAVRLRRSLHRLHRPRTVRRAEGSTANRMSAVQPVPTGCRRRLR